MLRKVGFSYNFSKSIHWVTVKFWFRYTLLQKCFQTDATFFYQGTVLAIKFRKRLTKFKITITLPKKFGSKGFITAVKVTKIWRSSDFSCICLSDLQLSSEVFPVFSWMQHLIRVYIRIQPVRRPQGKKAPKRLDVSKLKQDSKWQAFVNDICSRLDALELEDVDESWTVFRDTVHSLAMDS